MLQGFLYVLDHKGQAEEGWPLQMGEIQAQVAVADLRGDGSLALVAADARGNVAAFDAEANELWERHLGTLISQVSLLHPISRQQCKFQIQSALPAAGVVSVTDNHRYVRYQYRPIRRLQIWLHP